MLALQVSPLTKDTSDATWQALPFRKMGGREREAREEDKWYGEVAKKTGYARRAGDCELTELEKRDIPRWLPITARCPARQSASGPNQDRYGANEGPRALRIASLSSLATIVRTLHTPIFFSFSSPCRLHHLLVSVDLRSHLWRLICCHPEADWSGASTWRCPLQEAWDKKWEGGGQLMSSCTAHTCRAGKEPVKTTPLLPSHQPSPSFSPSHPIHFSAPVVRLRSTIAVLTFDLIFHWKKITFPRFVFLSPFSVAFFIIFQSSRGCQFAQRT